MDARFIPNSASIAATGEGRPLPLEEVHFSTDPFAQFKQWFDAASSCPQIEQPNAMSLSTVGSDGRPSSRTVLLKAFDHGLFELYTNYESRKGQQMTQTPFAALLFYWPALHRQGTTKKLSSSSTL
eukprot:TRINITY_DN8201_c0_g1_i2.p2 TRINITY_DN8201_c0_g1~~TRINITY_DN8201_c0_g1_i2.p2  ORF type:complete len:126 (-),score=29.05 TRINITY_DN8201_c0_g1_i2:568-945(-)